MNFLALGSPEDAIEAEELSNEVHAASSAARTGTNLLIVLAEQDAGAPESQAATGAVGETAAEAIVPCLGFHFSSGDGGHGDDTLQGRSQIRRMVIL